MAAPGANDGDACGEGEIGNRIPVEIERSVWHREFLNLEEGLYQAKCEVCTDAVSDYHDLRGWDSWVWGVGRGIKETGVCEEDVVNGRGKCVDWCETVFN